MNLQELPCREGCSIQLTPTDTHQGQWFLQNMGISVWTTGEPAISCLMQWSAATLHHQIRQSSGHLTKFTDLPSALGISIPTTLLPCITSTTRTEMTANDLARSLASSNSYINTRCRLNFKACNNGTGIYHATSAVMPSHNPVSSNRDSDSSSDAE